MRFAFLFAGNENESETEESDGDRKVQKTDKQENVRNGTLAILWHFSNVRLKVSPKEERKRLRSKKEPMKY